LKLEVLVVAAANDNLQALAHCFLSRSHFANRE
jgi:hypothetical protein